MIGHAYNSRDFESIPLTWSTAQMFEDVCLPWIPIYLNESFIRALNHSVTGIVLQLLLLLGFRDIFSSGRIIENKYKWSLLTNHSFSDGSVMVLLNKIYNQSLKSQLLQCPWDHMIQWSRSSVACHKWQAFMTVSAFCSHMITICSRHTQLHNLHKKSQWGSLQEATSHGHVTTCLTSIGD